MIYSFDDNNIENVISQYYNVYIKEIKKKTLYFDDVIVTPMRFPEVDGYDKSYLHFITKEYNKKLKCACPNRIIQCQKEFKYNPLINDKEPREICPHRILAIKRLENYFDRELKIWEKEISTKKGKRNRILCYNDYDNYLIILERKSNGQIMIRSGYPIDYAFRKDKLLDEYNRYVMKTGLYNYHKFIRK